MFWFRQAGHEQEYTPPVFFRTYGLAPEPLISAVSPSCSSGMATSSGRRPGILWEKVRRALYRPRARSHAMQVTSAGTFCLAAARRAYFRHSHHWTGLGNSGAGRRPSHAEIFMSQYPPEAPDPPRVDPSGPPPLPYASPMALGYAAGVYMPYVSARGRARVVIVLSCVVIACQLAMTWPQLAHIDEL